nr:MAG TPA: hypothetical protein [Caudoviricetes sp.]
MLDHLILNAKKWFEISNDMPAVTANNKSYYACPSRFTIMAETPIKSPNTGNDWRVLNDAEVTCVGAGKDVYFFDGQLEIYADGDEYKHPSDANYSHYYYTGVVKKENVRNVIWGGKKSPLSAVVSMVERAFAQFKKGAETC